MTETSNNTPFSELPASLVQEVLDRTDEIGKILLKTFDDVKNQRNVWRTQLAEHGYINKKSSLPLVPIPTSPRRT